MRRRPVFVLVCALISVVALALSVAPAAAVATLDEVMAELNTNRVFMEEEGADGDVAVLAAAMQRAVDNGINAYAVVLSDDGSGIKTQDVQARLDADATVLIYTPRNFDFESLDVCKSRFDQARATADTEITTGSASQGVDAFINAIINTPEDADCNQPVEESGGSSWLRWLLVALAALFLIALVWTLLRVLAANRRRQREEEEFEERRRILKDWAGTLRAPVTELQPHVAAAKSSSLAAMYNDALKVARESEGNLDKAQGLPDLDAAEIRIARAQMQIRDVRKGLLRD